MKTKLLTLIVAMIVVTSVNGQKGNINLTISSGLSHSIILGNNYQPNKLNLNINADLLFSYGITEKLAIKTGFAFRTKGRKTEVHFTNDQGDPIGTTDGKASLHYIVTPLLLSITAGENKVFFIDAGLFHGLFLNGKQKILNIETEITEVKRSDIGLMVGFGLNIPISEKVRIVMALHNELSLLNLSKTPIHGGGSAINNTTSFSLGINFNIKQ
jgi:hypothetical protein